MNTDFQDLQDQKDRALKSAYFCYVLAILLALVTTWFSIQGILATEPGSTARYARIAAAVLLAIIQYSAFSLAGMWREHAMQLRTLGYVLMVLQIGLMTLGQYSAGASAAKAARLSTATVEEAIAQSKAVREAAQQVQKDAQQMSNSKHEWKRVDAARKSEKALTALTPASGTVAQPQSTSVTTVPIAETIGEVWMAVLSLVLAVVFEGTVTLLMHVAGSLRAKASTGQPVESQILTMLRKLSEPSPVEPKEQTEETAHGEKEEKKERRVGMGFLSQEDETLVPAARKSQPVEARHNGPAPGEIWAPARKEYFLAPRRSEEAAAPSAPAAAPETVPSPAQLAVAAEPESVPAPAPAVSDRVRMTVSDGVREDDATISAPAPAPLPAPEPVPVPVPAPTAKRETKPRTAKPASAVRYDTGTDDESVRYRLVVEAVRAEKIIPSFGAIEKIAGCRQSVAEKFRLAMLRDDIIEPDPEKKGWFRLKKPAADSAQLALEV